ncbi:FAD:protein FMN transferase [uncultured Microbacterium sp.]|uniref:FAD:protein FMN transferase n=1 Tax=uncultured Microbacterium sp. TaxID=191216 RepID=UPI0035CC64D9
MAMASAPPRASWRFEAIGTGWEIETSTLLGSDARNAIGASIAAFDAAWSRFRPDSLVSQLARDAGTVPAPVDAVDMLEAYGALADATAGAVNPLIGAALESRGYDAAYSFIDRGPLATPADWRDRLTWTDGVLTLDQPATIDVGALGKGRLVDRVAEIVRSFVDDDIVVDASGDLAVRGAGVRVGLEHPYDPKRAIGVWEVTDAALCASAVNRRAWGDGLHHVLDARTGAPVHTVAATWAVAGTAMRADAIATALFFDGGEALAAEWGVEWVRMTTDGRVEWSRGSKAELFV